MFLFGRVVFSAILVLGIMLCIFGLYLERSSLDDGLKIGLLEAGVVPSVQQSEQFLAVCDEKMTGIFVFAQTEAELKKVAEDCLRGARAVQKSRPSDGYAWYVEAAALWGVDDWVGAQAALLQSQKHAPNEGWLAGKRIFFWVDFLEVDSMFETQAFWDDFEVAMHVREHQQDLAQLYFDVPQVNARMSSLIETRPIDIQNQMLGIIRRVGRGVN